MDRRRRIIAGLMAVTMLASGCYGPFNLTRKLHRWNGQVGDKWINELVFIVLVWVPIYELAMLGDGIIFNSIEFWGGQNPVPSASGVRTKRIVRGQDEAIMTFGPEAGQMTVDQFHAGQPAGSLRVEQRNGVTVASDANGRVLFQAQTLPDGSVIVSDATGARQAFYSPDEASRMLASVRHDRSAGSQ